MNKSTKVGFDPVAAYTVRLALGQYNLAGALLEGIPGAPSPKEAIEWNEKAALQGSIAAMVGMGYIYETGQVGAHDPVKAWAWYSVALDFDPMNPAANEGIQRVEEILSDEEFEEADKLSESIRIKINEDEMD